MKQLIQTTSRIGLRLFLLVGLLAGLLTVSGTSPAYAASFTVLNNNDSGAGSLRQAILDANANAGADIITFSVSGTITLGSALPAISDDVTIDGTGQTITVDGASTYQVMSVNSGKTAALKALTIAHGLTNLSGGGIINNGTLNVTNSTFSANSASYAGAIYNSGGTLTVTDTTFSGNVSTYGGAIWNDGGTLIVTDSTFSGNNAVSPLGGGGAIANTNSGGVTVLNSTFSSNSASSSSNAAGGAIDNNSGTLTVTDSTFSGNSTDFGNGGGIYNNGGALNVTSSTFSGNQVTNIGVGGAIYSAAGGTIANSTFNGNSTTNGSGGAIYFSGGLTISSSTISGNTASASGGGIYDGNVAQGNLGKVGNSIVALNTAAVEPDIASAGELLLVHNDVLGISASVIASPTNKVNINPLLGPLQDNGGPTKTMALNPNSPAINSAASIDSYLGHTLSTDQRGLARPQGGSYDVGAYELQPTQSGPNYVVNVTADTNDGFCDILGQGVGNQDCTLREAITAANTTAGTDTITFSVSGTITLGSALPAINDDVTIDGTGQTVTVDGANAFRPFTVNSGKTVTLKLLTIAHGSAQLGGGVNNAGTLTIIDSTFSANRATTPAGFVTMQGGALYNTGTLDVRNSTFTGNLAGPNTNDCDAYGGAFSNSGMATVTNSTFSGNLVYSHCNDSVSSGGAIYNGYGAILTVTNSTISGNGTGAGNASAGGIRNQAGGSSHPNGILNLSNSILANNGSDCVSDGTVGTTTNNLIVQNGSGANLKCGTAPTSDPLLGALANNGGPTQTFALLAGSPAIDTADNSAATAAGLTTDQRGAGYPRISNSTVDIGAFELQQQSQTISFAPLANKNVGDPDFTVSATASSGLTVTFSVGGSDQCTISGNLVHITGLGSCTVTAHQAGNGIYAAAPDVSQSFTIALATPIITWSNPADILVGTALSGTQLNATASVSGSFVYTPVAGTVLPQGPSQILQADFTPTDTTNYATAHATVIINVLPISNQTITVTTHASANAAYNTTFPVAATASSGLPVAITTSGSCGGSGTGSATISMTSGTGTCTIYYDQAGNAGYNAAPQVTETTTALQINQTITFAALSNKTYGDPDFAVSATASSGLAVNFTASGNCTVAGSTVHLTGAGSCTITAHQAGNSNYNAAPDVARTFTIAQAVTSGPTCNGLAATIYVNAQNRIVGGPDNGKSYRGELNGTNGADVMVGTNGNDEISGKGGDDVICGGNGNDELSGGSGNDKLFGGAGKDTLYGDDGNDTLTGGTEADKFNGGSGTDTATDYTPSQGDTKSSVEIYNH